MLVIIVAYLLGSIPFGYLIVRAKEGGDIRRTGSGGTGATNVSRSAGKAAGVLTLVLDALKGASAVLLARWLLSATSVGAQETTTVEVSAVWWVSAASLAVIIGHIFPVWLKFRGGKGVATGVGVFLVLMPAAVVIAGLIFGGVMLLTRYVSLSSMVAALSIPITVLLWHTFVSRHTYFAQAMTTAVVGALLIVFAHRENIRRLMRAEERKFP